MSKMAKGTKRNNSSHLNVFVLVHQRGVNAQKSVKLFPGILDLAVRMQ